ncbi:MAG: AAA domain-containing protein [Candidatus Lokiarchaeota archaeon]|nr:AAA domain-containing protein [Candidatus Lokiarchaeota archaeon]
MATEAPQKSSEESFGIDVSAVREIAQDVLSEVSRVIVGYGDILQNLFIAVLANGHCLLEGVPGLAKSVMAKTFAKVLGASFKRIQFVPDLLPADITGAMVYNNKTGEFEVRKGPIFANFVLADELNRTAPKTQAAMLEAMGEKQTTIEGQTFPMENIFTVMATQNPIEQEGTYPLPEAQLDRFLFKLWLDYPDESGEVEIMRRQLSGRKIDVDIITDPEELLELRDLVDQVYVDQIILQYIRDIIHKTRTDPQILMGAGPRASLVLMKCSKARAALLGRNYVTPDDIRDLCIPALNHRLMLKAEAELEGVNVVAVINRILDETPCPL